MTRNVGRVRSWAVFVRFKRWSRPIEVEARAITALHIGTSRLGGALTLEVMWSGAHFAGIEIDILPTTFDLAMLTRDVLDWSECPPEQWMIVEDDDR